MKKAITAVLNLYNYLKKLSKHCLNVTKETSKAEGMPFVKYILYLVSFKTENF